MRKVIEVLFCALFITAALVSLCSCEADITPDTHVTPTAVLSDNTVPAETGSATATESDDVAPSPVQTYKPSPTPSPSTAPTPSPVHIKETPKPQNSHPYYVRINRAANCVTVYKTDTDEPVRAFICSTGTGTSTPVGTFKTTDKYVWRALFNDCYGQYATRITGSILFHSVPYFTRDKSNLEYEEYNKLGTAASMGCIRLTCIDAKWIYDNCPKGTTVEIYDDLSSPGPLGRPEAPYIDPESEFRGWDPTDPDPDNPWNTAP